MHLKEEKDCPASYQHQHLWWYGGSISAPLINTRWTIYIYTQCKSFSGKTFHQHNAQPCSAHITTAVVKESRGASGYLSAVQTCHHLKTLCALWSRKYKTQLLKPWIKQGKQNHNETSWSPQISLVKKRGDAGQWGTCTCTNVLATCCYLQSNIDFQIILHTYILHCAQSLNTFGHRFVHISKSRKSNRENSESK